MERILLKEDQKLFKSILSDLRLFSPVLANFVKVYNSLEIGSLTNDRFKEIITRRNPNFIIEKYKSMLVADAKTEVLKNLILSSARKQIDDYENAFSDVMNFAVPQGIISRPTLSLEYISMDGEEFIINEADQERLKEDYCRIYITSESELELFNNLQNLQSALNSFFKKLSDLRFLETLPPNIGYNSLDHFFQFENFTSTIQPNAIAWAVSAARKRRLADEENLKRIEKQSKFDELQLRKVYGQHVD